MLRVRKRCFWVISTPSSGRKWQKRIFFNFFFIAIHQNIFDSGCGNKKNFGMISKHFMFSYHKFFSVKVFHDDPRGSKHAKFKSKKQNFTNFKFLKFEAIIDPNKDLHKRKKQSNQKWTRYGNWKIFSSRLINFVALWWPKKSFVGIFVCGSSISAKKRSISYTNLKNKFFFEILVICSWFKPNSDWNKQ